ncbi:MAG: hypothetical protein WBA42_01320 [Mesorhizobium sp.]
MSDLYLYNGAIERGNDLRFIRQVAKDKRSTDCVLILVTPGGNPDAAYKIGRYLQQKYDSFKMLVPGLCKSAGTLLAIAAEELIFAPYGELGPLDVQMTKVDNLAGLESGLNISEAFLALEQRAKDTYHSLTMELITNSGGVVSLNKASHAATEIIAALYGPIFHKIDPEEVGSRSRAMRIGQDYGERLNAKWSNLKSTALKSLSESYSSHGFVIDHQETSLLFERVRIANENEMAIIEQLGSVTPFPQQTLTIRTLHNTTPQPTENQNVDEPNDHSADNDQSDPAGSDGGNPGEAVEA